MKAFRSRSLLRVPAIPDHLPDSSRGATELRWNLCGCGQLIEAPFTMCCGFNPSSCPSYFLFAPTHYKGCWKRPGGQVLWTRRRDLGSRGARIRSVSPSSISTGWPLFRRSSLKRSFRSRSWMTASFVPWISSSEAILAVLLAFFGNPLHSESRRGTVSTSPSQTGSITKAQRSKMLFTIYLFKAHAVVHMKRTTEDAFRSFGKHQPKSVLGEGSDTQEASPMAR